MNPNIHSTGAAARAGPQLVAESDAGMLGRILAAVTALVGARSAFMERTTPDPDVVEVVAAVGPGAPPHGFGPRASGAAAFTLPLRLDDADVGRIICLDMPSAVALDPTLPGQLELLACTGALALRNLALARELESATSAAAERRYRVTNAVVQHMKEVLGAAREYSQLIDVETELTDRQRQYLAASARNIEAGVRLMQELLDLGRIETGRVQVELEPIDVAAVVRGIARDYQLANGAGGVSFKVRTEEGVTRIRTDVDLLRRVLDTLLSNAVRFSPVDAPIEIALRTQPGRRARDPAAWLCIDVADEGPGLHDHQLVFDEGARAAALPVAPGFRLPIARRLMRLLGGDLTLESGERRGCRFTVWLPLPPGLALQR